MEEEKLFLCMYPYYRDFDMKKAYTGDIKDRMTGTTVETWAKENPDHWKILIKGIDFV